MPDIQIPYQVKRFASLDEIRIGDLLLADTDSDGTCTNCHDPDGLFYFHRILPGGGRIHWITDAYDRRRMYYAELISAPCPVCRPWKQAATLPDLPDIGNEPPPIKDWTV